MLPGALDIPATQDGKTLREIQAGSESSFDYLNDLVELFCVERDANRVCMMGLYENGPAVAQQSVIGGTYTYESVFASADLYRIERTLEVPVEFKADLLARARSANISFAEEPATIRQQNGRYFDSTNPGMGGYGVVNEGAATTFIALHIDPGYAGDPIAMDDIAVLSNVRQLGVPASDGTVHYRADVSGQIGESGTWDIWVGEDGLPRRIEVEAFNPPRWANYRSDELEVTRVSIDFLDYGVPLDPEDPLARLSFLKSLYEEWEDEYVTTGSDRTIEFEDGLINLVWTKGTPLALDADYVPAVLIQRTKLYGEYSAPWASPGQTDLYVRLPRTCGTGRDNANMWCWHAPHS